MNKDTQINFIVYDCHLVDYLEFTQQPSAMSSTIVFPETGHCSASASWIEKKVIQFFQLLSPFLHLLISMDCLIQPSECDVTDNMLYIGGEGS